MSVRRRYRCCSRCNKPGHMVNKCPKKEPAFKMPTRAQMPSVSDRHSVLLRALYAGKIRPEAASTLFYHLAFECLQDIRGSAHAALNLMVKPLTIERLNQLRDWWSKTVAIDLARTAHTLGLDVHGTPIEYSPPPPLLKLVPLHAGEH